MGELLALKAWYCDTTHRYAMTDAVQPLIVTSAGARKPADEPKADLRRYYMLAHGSHLVDTARYLGGDDRGGRRPADRTVRRLLLVRRRRLRRRRARPPRPDGRGADGLARGLPDLRRERQRARQDLQPLVLQDAATSTSSARRTAADTRVLGADGHFYRRQLEGFADVDPRRRADAGRRRSRTASPRCAAMVAIARSAETGRPVAPRRRRRGRLMQLGIFAKTFARRPAPRRARPRSAARATPPRSSTWPASACPPCRTRSTRRRAGTSPPPRGAAASRSPRSPAPTT